MITHWWLNEMPPISGALRAVFYAGLLILCIVDHPSPLHSAKIIAGTEQAFYTPVGVMRMLGLRWVGPRTLSVVAVLTVIAWTAATVGFLQPIAGILTFLGFAFLHKVNAGALGSNHSTHSALYALFCMSFSVSYDYSLDGYLARHAHWPLLVPEHSVFGSGFAPLLLLVLLAYTVFAGGLAKLRYGWSGWLDGSALRFYLEESAVAARWPRLSRLLVGSPRLCRHLAWLTLVVELSAPAAIGSSSLRMPLILAWACLHIGILLVMMPAYWVQMWCYLLLLDWPRILAAVLGRQPGEALEAVGSGFGGTVFTAVGLLACAALVAVLLRESEQWPFTSVPMYSNGPAAGAVRLPAREELHSRAVRARRGRHAAWQRAWVGEEVMEDIWLTPVGDGEPKRLFHLMHEHRVAKFVRWSQYSKVVRGIAIADVAARPAGGLAFDPADREYPATRFLRTVAPVVRNALPDWQRYERLDLVCRTDSGGVVIGRADLSEESVRRAPSTRP